MPSPSSVGDVALKSLFKPVGFATVSYLVQPSVLYLDRYILGVKAHHVSLTLAGLVLHQVANKSCLLISLPFLVLKPVLTTSSISV